MAIQDAELTRAVEDILDPEQPRTRWVAGSGWVQKWKPNSGEIRQIQETRNQVFELFKDLLRADDLGAFKDESQRIPPGIARVLISEEDYPFALMCGHHPFYEGIYRLSQSDSVRAHFFRLTLENLDYLLKNRHTLSKSSARRVQNDTGDMLHWLGHIYEEAATEFEKPAYWKPAYRFHRYSLRLYSMSKLKRSQAINGLNGEEHANFHIEELENRFPDWFPFETQ